MSLISKEARWALPQKERRRKRGRGGEEMYENPDNSFGTNGGTSLSKRELSRSPYEGGGIR